MASSEGAIEHRGADGLIHQTTRAHREFHGIDDAGALLTGLETMRMTEVPKGPCQHAINEQLVRLVLDDLGTMSQPDSPNPIAEVQHITRLLLLRPRKPSHLEGKLPAESTPGSAIAKQLCGRHRKQCLPGVDHHSQRAIIGFMGPPFRCGRGRIRAAHASEGPEDHADHPAAGDGIPPAPSIKPADRMAITTAARMVPRTIPPTP